ncbi:ABC transporter permease [Pseudonocardia spinosispora]|uniref:ABC transporter permease n=1 Tax=Pseudonocardia spinosispora TaxID=103441 RepID=UPI00041919C1|nr:ABC transporter permease [Pseudonocardia spinosispora]
MNLLQALMLAFRSMRAARLRSTLTTFGITVGIASVVVLTGLGDGLKTNFNDSLGAFTTAVVVNRVGSTVVPGGPVRVLREEDAAALANSPTSPDIARVTPIANGASVVRYNGSEYNATTLGTDAAYISLFDRHMVSGRNFNPAEEAEGDRVVLLGPGMVQQLYHNDPNAALDTKVQIGRLTFNVVGTFAGGSSLAPAPDDLAVIPLKASRALYGRTDKLNQIAVQTTGVKRVEAAIGQIETVMDRQHGITEVGLRDFQLSASFPIVEKTNSFLFGITLFILSVGGVALFVGGLGVANIMLVTVTERTHEIGIRKALGARKSAILKQFLIEATVLSGIGGVVGSTLGVGLILLCAEILPRMSVDYGVPTISVPAVAVAFGVSLALGLVAGGYPAFRAARLHPIDALRY